METVLAGTILQCCRTAFLPHVGNCRRALLLGEGPGRFLVELLTANARIEVVCVEQSLRMIEKSRRALRQRGIDHTRVQFVQMDVLERRPAAESFDLVATHFFLDCFRRDKCHGGCPLVELGLPVVVARMASPTRVAGVAVDVSILQTHDWHFGIVADGP